MSSSFCFAKKFSPCKRARSLTQRQHLMIVWSSPRAWSTSIQKRKHIVQYETEKEQQKHTKQWSSIDSRKRIECHWDATQFQRLEISTGH